MELSAWQDLKNLWLILGHGCLWLAPEGEGCVEEPVWA